MRPFRNSGLRRQRPFGRRPAPQGLKLLDREFGSLNGPMQHRMAVGANRDQVLDRIDLVLLADLGERNPVVNICEAPTHPAIDGFKVDRASRTAEAMVLAKLLSGAGVSLVAIGSDLFPGPPLASPSISSHGNQLTVGCESCNGLQELVESSFPGPIGPCLRITVRVAGVRRRKLRVIVQRRGLSRREANFRVTLIRERLEVVLERRRRNPGPLKAINQLWVHILVLIAAVL